MIKYILFAVAGVLGGVLGGMGMGGGTLLIPILTLMFGTGQAQSQGINLISFIPMSVIAIIIHAKNKLVDFKSVWLIALTALAFGVLGSLLLKLVGGNLQRTLFGCFLICLSVVQFFIVKSSSSQDKKDSRHNA